MPEPISFKALGTWYEFDAGTCQVFLDDISREFQLQKDRHLKSMLLIAHCVIATIAKERWADFIDNNPVPEE